MQAESEEESDEEDSFRGFARFEGTSRSTEAENAVEESAEQAATQEGELDGKKAPAEMGEECSAHQKEESEVGGEAKQAETAASVAVSVIQARPRRKKREIPELTGGDLARIVEVCHG